METFKIILAASAMIATAIIIRSADIFSKNAVLSASAIYGAESCSRFNSITLEDAAKNIFYSINDRCGGGK